MGGNKGAEKRMRELSVQAIVKIAAEEIIMLFTVSLSRTQVYPGDNYGERHRAGAS